MKLSNILWGLVLILIGIIFGLNALDIADINIFFDGWWTLFIIVPCFIDLFKDKDKSGNIIGYEYKHLSWNNSDTLAEITARLQTQFMNKGKYETTRVEEVAGVPTFATENTYGKYRSYIVYDEGNTTNIIGVILLLDPNIIRGGD